MSLDFLVLLLFSAAIFALVGWGIYLLWASLFCTSCDDDRENTPTTTERQARLRHPDDSFTEDEKRYWDRVEDLAAELGTDGCTKVINVHVRCCDLHDVFYILRHDPFDPDNPPITKAQADRRFLDCMRRHSWMGFWNPVAYIRYLFVRRFGNGGKEWAE